jgi:hypothetical protein
VQLGVVDLAAKKPAFQSVVFGGSRGMVGPVTFDEISGDHYEGLGRRREVRSEIAPDG